MAAAELDIQNESPLRLFRTMDSTGRLTVKDLTPYRRSSESIIPLTYSQSLVGHSTMEELISSNSSTSSVSSRGSRLYKKSHETGASGSKKRLYKRFSKGNRNGHKGELTIKSDRICKDSGLDLDSQDCTENGGPILGRPSYEQSTHNVVSVSCLDPSDMQNTPANMTGQPRTAISRKLEFTMKSSSESNLTSNIFWQPPTSDLYNVQLTDCEDPETLRSMAQRHRTAAAKLLPKMQLRCQRDSGVVIHERTSSKDSGTSSSPSPYLLNSASANSLEGSSMITDLSNISCPESNFTDLASRLELPRIKVQTGMEDDLLYPSPVNDAQECREPDGDYECPNQVAEVYQLNMMSSSNLVYAVPVKTTSDPPLSPQCEGFKSPLPKNVESYAHIYDSKEDSLSLHSNSSSLNPGECGHMQATGEFSRFPSPQSQRKRTVVPVYPLQTCPPVVESKMKSMVKEYHHLKCVGFGMGHLRPDSTAEGCVLKIPELGVNPVKCNTSVSESVEDCLSKPLDVVLSNVMNKITAAVRPFEGMKSSGDAYYEHESSFNTDLSSNVLHNKSSYEHRENSTKKDELLARWTRKLKVLKEEKREIEEEMKANDAIGNRLLSLVNNSQASVSLKNRVRLYLEDVERITKLFLMLSTQAKRIAIEENSNEGNQDESHLVDVRRRRSQVLSQLEDARELKNGIYRRGTQLACLLPQILNADQMVDYQYFVRMKSKLLVEAHEIDEKVGQGEAQKAILDGI